MRNFLHGVLLIIYTFVLIFTAHPAPARPTPPNNISDLEYTQIQSNRSMALKKPIDPNHPLITFQTKFPAASVILDDATGLPYVISDIQLNREVGRQRKSRMIFCWKWGGFDAGRAVPLNWKGSKCCAAGILSMSTSSSLSRDSCLSRCRLCPYPKWTCSDVHRKVSTDRGIP